jgi:hypothetical protein
MACSRAMCGRSWLVSERRTHSTATGRSPSTRTNAADSPIGTWRGQSTCLVKASACRDEDSVYRAAAVAKSETRVALEANKIVDGKEVNMGTSECSYSPATHLLNCPLPNGNTVRFKLKGETLNGTMTLADGTRWRSIALRRSAK